MIFPFMLSLPVLSKAEGSKHKMDLDNSPFSFDSRVLSTADWNEIARASVSLISWEVFNDY
jgi:hypothetical protein